MGRTLASITQVFLQEQEAFSRFRRALRRSDQEAMDDLFIAARKHLSAAAYVAHALPFEVSGNAVGRTQRSYPACAIIEEKQDE